MKRILQHSLVLTLCLAFFTAHAQFGGGGASGPDFSGAMSKLFGENTAFSSDVEVEAKGGPTGDMNMPAKISYLDGKSRFELNLSEMKGANLPPQAMEQMKQMGMDKLTTISIPDEKLVFMIYPSLKAYAEMPVPNSSGAKGKAEFDVQLTELGKEDVDGHECVKNKATVKDKDGKTTEFTVWNATDAKKFPVKITTTQQGMDIAMSFKNVKFDKPEAKLFKAPSDFTKYDSMMSLMQQEVMKRMQNAPPPR
jgi:hypothetical protein